MGASLATKLQMVAAGGLNPILNPNNPDLIVMYTMDNISGSTLVDENPNGNDSTITGAIAVPGLIGNALDFDGINDLTDRASITGFPGSGHFSVSIWVKPGILTGSHQIFGIGGDTGNITLGSYLAHTSGGYFVAVNDANGGFTDPAQALISTPVDTIWDHVVGVFPIASGGTGKIYLNEVLKDTFVSSQVINDTNGPLRLGRRTQIGGANFFDGGMDLARIFKREVIQSEVSALYNGGVGA